MLSRNQNLKRTENAFTEPEVGRKFFGRAIRARRRDLSISQKTLGQRSALHRTYICDIERGNRNVPLDNILRLAIALEISSGALFQLAFSGATVETPAEK
jgi:transcriptional regulator with XRE-family HTH domain